MLPLVKKVLLPTRQRVRTLPLGIGRGLRMGVDFSRQSRMYLGLYEVELNGWLRRLCRPGFRAFDVGGQFGYDALVIAKLTGAPVISFECVPELCGVIASNVAANQPYVGLVSVRRAMVASATDPGSHTLALDDAAADAFCPDVIKMDIEGGEVDALLGAQAILARRRTNLVIEVHSRDLEEHCRSILESHGYAPVAVDQRRWLRDHRPAEHNRWLVAEARAADHPPGPSRRR